MKRRPLFLIGSATAVEVGARAIEGPCRSPATPSRSKQSELPRTAAEGAEKARSALKNLKISVSWRDRLYGSGFVEELGKGDIIEMDGKDRDYVDDY